MQSLEDDDLILVKPRQENCMYHVDVGRSGDVFILIQDNGKDQELAVLQTQVNALPLKDDEFRVLEALPHKAGYAITDMEIFHDFIALCERATLDGRQRIRVVDRWTGGDEWIVPLPEDQAAVSMLLLAGNMNYFAKFIRFHVESPVLCRATYEYDVRSRRVRHVSGDAPSDEYILDRALVNSQDGTLVPLSIVYRKDLVENVERETITVVLIGYGAYGHPMDLSFNPAYQPLLKRGFVIAYAHTRGGGDLGGSWYRRGRLYEKMRGIEDYLACAQALKWDVLDRKVQLTAKAFSAGGVLVGAAVSQRPDLFHSVVLTNAFLDVYETMMNDELHLTQHEWEEYGNPSTDERAAKSIASYCPVRNVPSSVYLPGFLLIGTMDDRQVPFFNTVIFAKKLLGINEKSRVALYLASCGGHHLGSNRVHVASLEAAFIINSNS